jgi:hypothetical protein
MLNLIRLRSTNLMRLRSTLPKAHPSDESLQTFLLKLSKISTQIKSDILNNHHTPNPRVHVDRSTPNKQCHYEKRKNKTENDSISFIFISGEENFSCSKGWNNLHRRESRLENLGIDEFQQACVCIPLVS